MLEKLKKLYEFDAISVKKITIRSMRTIKTVFCLLSLVSLVACTSENLAPVPTDDVASSRTLSETIDQDGHGLLNVIDIPEIHLSFPYWKNLTRIKNVDYMGNPDRNGEYGFDLTGTGKTAFLTVVRYDRQSDGVHDWSIPRSIPDALSERIDTNSCDLLQGKDVYLPVEFSRLHRCKTVTTWNGSMPIMAAIGYGQPFESADFVQDTIVLLGKDYAYILSSVVDFPQSQKAFNNLWEEHLREHPDTEFPNAQWDSFTKKASALVESQLQNNSLEIENNLGLLVTIARGMRLE